MCGLVGVLTKFGSSGLSVVESDNFDTLLYVDAIRGYDSTGVFGVNRWGNLEWFKAVGAPGRLLGDKLYKDYSNELIRSGVAMIGHNRKATVGAIDDVSAHPFTEGHITVVHNGKIDNAKALEPSVSVDSHSVAYLFEREDYHTALSKLVGAFALIWYDAKAQKIYWCRNDKRPLSIFETTQSYYIGSENDMLEWVVGRSSATIQKRTEIKPGDVWSYNVVTNKVDVEENVFNPVFTYLPPSTPSQTAGQQHSTGKHGTNNKGNGRSRLSREKAGTTIKFELYDYKEVPDATGKFDSIGMGVTLDSPYEEVRFHCAIDDLHAMEQCDHCTGELAYTSTTKEGVVTWLVASSIKGVTKTKADWEEDDIPVSINNEILTKQIWSTMGKTCASASCNKKIQKADIEYCITDFSTKRRKAWCPKCSQELLKQTKSSMMTH